MSGKIKIGIVGCGVISEIYMQNLTHRFKNVEIVATMDLIRERAENRAKQFNVPKVHDLEDFYKDPEIELVVNLTTPQSHTDVDLRALNGGKHVYSEKPFGLNKADGQKVIELAKSKNLLVGCAPETFLGGGLQMCRKIIDEGWIGLPVAATAFMMGHGHESWHPDPGFYYDFGGGPMFDMGPYYLTALVSMLGPVKKVAGATKISFPTRLITSQPLNGTVIDVKVPTYVTGTLTFESGVIGTIIQTFDVWDSTLPCIEIYGSEGSLRVPDPNTFGGPVLYKKPGMEKWQEVPIEFIYQENSRGIGVSDMAQSIINNRTHRAHGNMAYHVLDIMCSVHDSNDSDKILTLDSTFERPALFPLGLTDGILD
ncbi:MAG: Gfo/Idh/MocA family oxidoreductase [Oscillospiraceae bacterium]|nr:Gfo/Idh/MocA family oxidoreductase [Oscillospiraceae bacterium]